VGHLTRNVQAEHIQEIFSTFGTVKHVELAMDKAVNLPRGFAYVEFSKRSEAEDAQRLMDGGQLDGNQLRWVVLAHFATCMPPALLHHSLLSYNANKSLPYNHVHLLSIALFDICALPLQHVYNVALLAPYHVWSHELHHSMTAYKVAL